MDTLSTAAAKGSTVAGVKARASSFSPGTAQVVVTIMVGLDWVGDSRVIPKLISECKIDRIPGHGIHDKFHWFLVPEQWDCFLNLASYKIIKYIFFRDSHQNKPLLALTSFPGDAMSNRRDVNHLVLYWKEFNYSFSLPGIYRTLNPSRVLLILLLCHVHENKEAQVCCPESCLKYVSSTRTVPTGHS